MKETKELKVKRKQKNSASGITLIALVVTIIVLMIISGITVATLMGDNGIIKRAGDAKEKTVTAQEEESAKLTFTEIQMELTQGKFVDSDKFQQMVDGNFGSNKATGTIGGNKYIITVARTGVNYQMDSAGNIGTLDVLPIDFAPGILEQNGNTYTINSIEDLVAFSYNVDSGTELYEGKTVELGRNLDFQDDNSYVDATSKYKKDDNGYILDTTATNTIKGLMTNTEGAGFIPVGNDSTNTFKGNFDGKQKELNNLYINSDGLCGLFGYISSNVEISDVLLNSINIRGTSPSGNQPSGGIAGNVQGANIKIKNSSVSGKINSTSVSGGVVGEAYGTNITIEDSFASGEIVSSISCGGILGNYGGNIIINKCTNNATITGNSAGGIAGGDSGSTSSSSAGMTITNCINKKSVVSNSGFAGGIIGNKGGTVINCYNEGNVSGYNGAGGIAGGAIGKIINCFNNGDISAPNCVGGILGNGSTAETISNCYNFKSVTSTVVAGGILTGSVNSISDCYNSGTIKTTGTAPVGGIMPFGSPANCHNTGTIIGGNSNICGEIIGTGTANSNNDYLKKTSGNANGNGAREEDDEETMFGIMSVQNFVNLMNSTVTTNNADSTKTKLKTWTVENGFPVFDNN